jgi:Mn-dependent DtxR family transcriptional regulator
LSPPSDDLELQLLPAVAVRRLTGDGLVRYSQRSSAHLEQAGIEALRRLERRVLKAQLERGEHA